MMFLSHLLIDIGDHPDRPRPGRLWLRNIYRVHQRLSMAFPSATQRTEDPLFLKPYDPAGFDRSRILFRIDNSMEDFSPRASILVQSALRPDWGYAFQNAAMFLAAPPQVKEFDPTFMAGEQYRFRIRMNLSKKVKLSREGTDLRTRRPGCDSKGRERSQSKRVSLNWNKDQDPESVIRDWFGLKAARCGFGLEKMQVVEMGRVTGFKGASAGEDRALGKLQFLSALLEGILSISNVPDFEGALSSGIGPAKAFGFGLLSIAPIRSSDHAAPRPPSTSEVS